MDFICHGTLQRRLKTCGKPKCACATNKKARHGPYYVWQRLHQGRLIQTTLPPSVVPAFVKAAGNYRRLRELIKEWSQEFLRTVENDVDLIP